MRLYAPKCVLRASGLLPVVAVCTSDKITSFNNHWVSLLSLFTLHTICSTSINFEDLVIFGGC